MRTCWRFFAGAMWLTAALPAVWASNARAEPSEEAVKTTVAGTPTAAQRGREALLTRCFSAPFVSRAGYETLWKQWGLKGRPGDFDAQVRERYGLHEAPYPNDGLPMGLRATEARRGVAAVGIDCMLCHGSSLFGKSYIGLPNTSIDLVGLFRDLDFANGAFGIFPYRVSNVRGTTESTATGVFVISLRDANLNLHLPPADIRPIPDQLCEDAPAWWLLKRKDTMYYNGQIDARAVRPLMMFMLSPGADPAIFAREERTFADIREYLLTVQPPKYPLPVNAALAGRGRIVFEENCAKCHGTYTVGGGAGGGGGGEAGACGPSAGAAYPNRIVPLAKVGTDPSLVGGLTPAIEEHFRKSWFTRERGPDGRPFPLRYNAGYQAPPLDGVWATAPYLHNGSVPTLYQLLKSDQRPRVFTRSYQSGVDDYDADRVGWKVTELPQAPPARTPREARQIYDTSRPGRSNAGHTFGDALDDRERRAVIEYLKTL
jgi:processive rubber oxygenase RoxA-like protein